MDEILTIILKDTYSLTQYKHRVKILKAFLVQNFFGGSQPSTTELTAQDSAWLKSLPPAFLQKFTKENVYETFTNLEKADTSLKVLIMHLAFEIDDVTLSQLGAYARKTFASPSLLLDIKFDPNLIAGTALSWKGRVKDYSLKAKLEAKRDELSQEFRRFLR